MPLDHSHRLASVFNRTVFSTILLLLAATAVLSVVVDPYGLFGGPSLPGLTTIKSAAASRLRLSKASAVERVQPATLVTGSSVTNLGIDPNDGAWTPADRPVFNLGIDGATILLQRRFLLHALTVTRPRRVVIITSFDDYAPASVDGGSDTAGLPALHVGEDGQPNPHYVRDHLVDLAATTLSFRALSDSVATLLWQSGALLSYQTAEGFAVDAPEEQYATLHGVTAAVSKTEGDMARRLLRWGLDPQPSVQALADMIHAARSADAEVVVVIPPVTVEMIEMRRQLGLEANVAIWRADVARAVNREWADHVSLWDFGNLSPYDTAQPTDGVAVTDPHLWFWDAVHFTPALGGLIIRRIEGDDNPADFGERLDVETVAISSLKSTAAQQAWAASHPDEVRAVAAVVAAVKRKLCTMPETLCEPAGPPVLALTDAATP